MAITIVDIPCVVTRNGKKEKLMLKDVTYVPESQYNLFSLTKLISNGWTMTGDKNVGIKMSKGATRSSLTRQCILPKVCSMWWC
jgi:hypothetical protein